MPFSALGLAAPLLKALTACGFTEPTPIQSQAIPAILAGRDLMAAAQTGTGKTAAFALPLIQHLARQSDLKPNHIRALILAPTRELAMQIAEATAAFANQLSLRTGLVYGGVKINPQMISLRRGFDILVATPGRLLDLHRQNAVRFSQVEILVIDEADRMLDLGFMDDVGKIIALLPAKRQNLLFSATLSAAIRSLAAGLLRNPLLIEVDPANSAAKNVSHWLYEVDAGKKPDLLTHLLRNNDWQQVLVFTRTRLGADRLVQRLAVKGISALALHSDKSQALRTRALAEFKANAIRVLVATDIAARGLDISELSHVINVDLPKVATDYIHRIGRTGRAGLTGVAISLVSADEVPLLAAIETLLGRLLVREVITGFIPKHSVPLTQLGKARPKKPKKLKKVPLVAEPGQPRPIPLGQPGQRQTRRGSADPEGEQWQPPSRGRRQQRSTKK